MAIATLVSLNLHYQNTLFSISKTPSRCYITQVTGSRITTFHVVSQRSKTLQFRLNGTKVCGLPQGSKLSREVVKRTTLTTQTIWPSGRYSAKMNASVVENLHAVSYIFLLEVGQIPKRARGLGNNRIAALMYVLDAFGVHILLDSYKRILANIPDIGAFIIAIKVA